MRRFAVIMAGGAGERFWPASRRARPKQLLRLTDAKQSMVEEAISRISPLIPTEQVLVATSETLVAPIAEALPGLPRENIVGEPEKRNTAACLALAAAHLSSRGLDPADVSMAVLTADHQIGAPERFQGRRGRPVPHRKKPGTRRRPKLRLRRLTVERTVQAIDQGLFVERLVQEGAGAGVQHPRPDLLVKRRRYEDDRRPVTVGNEHILQLGSAHSGHT